MGLHKNIVLKYEIATAEQMQKLGNAFAPVANHVWQKSPGPEKNIVAVEASPGAGKSTFLHAVLLGLDPDNVCKFTGKKTQLNGRDVVVWENMFSGRRKIQHRVFDRMLVDAYNSSAKLADDTMYVPDRKYPGIDFVENPYIVPQGKVISRIDILRKKSTGGERRVLIKIPIPFKDAEPVHAFVRDVQELQIL